MKIENQNIYSEIYKFNNLLNAWVNAKKGKTKRRYVKRFQKKLQPNLIKLQKELINQSYYPNKLKTFILRDPKTRKISKSAFRDRMIHHALCNIIVPIFEKEFIYDCHANIVGKGTLKALSRFDKFKKKVSKNNTQNCYVLKADIKHYFEEINHEILIRIIRKRIQDERVISLICKILGNSPIQKCGTLNKGMPLGNLTSQFFANLYLNELDQFVKHKLKARYYIRYVDDFVILHKDKEQLEKWKIEISNFLNEKLKIELHPSKSHVINLNNGINFLGFRIFYYHKLIRKSNLKNFERKLNHLRILFNEEIIGREKALESLEGWLAYCSHANTYKYRKYLVKYFNKSFSYGNKLQIHNKQVYLNYVHKVKESELLFSVQKTSLQFKKGWSIKEIAIKEGIKESTVWAHIINLIEHKQLSVWQVLHYDKIHKILNKIYSDKERLKNIKKRLKDESITYDEIACVMASIKSKKRWNKKCPATK